METMTAKVIIKLQRNTVIYVEKDSGRQRNNNIENYE